MRWSVAQWGVLLLLSALAAFSWWLNGRSLDQRAPSGVELPGGFEARDINIAQYLPQGAVQYRLLATSMKQYGDGAPTDLLSPVLEHIEPGGAATRFNAPLARWQEDTNILQFPQQLTVNRPAVGKAPALHFEAQQVLVDNNRRTVVGTGKVKARLGRSTIEGTGLEYDWVRRVLVLKSRVRMVYAKNP